MPRPIQEPTQDEYGADVHPAFGHIKINRVSATPGVTLFDSEIRHQHFVTITVSGASCKRDLNHNWIHEGKALLEIEMSEAQWASFVSSPNTSGVPCTIKRTETDWQVPGLPHRPVLGQSLKETREAADQAFEGIKDAFDAYEAAIKGPAKERNEALRNLRAAIHNATANVVFAASSLNKHAENTVQKARADVEAMVLRAVQQHALEAGDDLPVLELEQ